MLTSRKQSGLDEAAAGIAEAVPGARLATFAANAGDPDQAEKCVAACVERFGALDVLVNNAATNPVMGATIDADLPAWDKTFQVNVRGTFVWSQLAWRSWMRAHGGSIINLSSIGGLRGDAAIGVYNTTKAAIAHLTKILAVELAPGVRVNCIAPGLVKTDFARALWEPAGDVVAAGLPLRRLGEPRTSRTRPGSSRARARPGSPATRWSSTAARWRAPRPSLPGAVERELEVGETGRLRLQLVDAPAVVGVDGVD